MKAEISHCRKQFSLYQTGNVKTALFTAAATYTMLLRQNIFQPRTTYKPRRVILRTSQEYRKHMGRTRC